jgi:hypothetical protein
MKKLRPEVKETLQFKGGFDNLIDITIKSSYNITDEEMDDISYLATDDELDIFTTVVSGQTIPTFTELKNAILIRNKYVAYFQK